MKDQPSKWGNDSEDIVIVPFLPDDDLHYCGQRVSQGCEEIVLTSFATFCAVYYGSDLSKKMTTTTREKTALNVLEGGAKTMYKFILSKEDDCLQKDLLYELGFSKAKVTRVLDKLVMKGLVERISCGKTNKVRIKK